MIKPNLPKAIQLCLTFVLCFSTEIFSQDFNPEANRHQKLGDSLENAKQYKLAARHYHAIQEGMADFIGELISGKTANERLHDWAVGNEQKVWAEFKKEMFLNRYSNWIANSNQETADRPSDLGYWVGYQICKAYFEQASDKEKAISDMLNIQDYKAFLITSKADEKLSNSNK